MFGRAFSDSQTFIMRVKKCPAPFESGGQNMTRIWSKLTRLEHYNIDIYMLADCIIDILHTVITEVILHRCSDFTEIQPISHPSKASPHVCQKWPFQWNMLFNNPPSCWEQNTLARSPSVQCQGGQNRSNNPSPPPLLGSVYRKRKRSEDVAEAGMSIVQRNVVLVSFGKTS